MPRGMEETKGVRPDPKFRDGISKYIWVELNRETRRLLNNAGRRRWWEHGIMTRDEALASMGFIVGPQNGTFRKG